MSVLLRPAGDDVAASYGTAYLNSKQLQKIKPGDKFEVLCNDHKHYRVEVKDFNSATMEGTLHFCFWKSRFDYHGSLKVVYLSPDGLYSEGKLSAQNTYIMNNPTRPVKRGKTTINSEFAEKTRYPEDFLTKPRLFSGRRRLREEDAEESRSGPDSPRQSPSSGYSRHKVHRGESGSNHFLLQQPFTFDDDGDTSADQQRSQYAVPSAALSDPDINVASCIHSIAADEASAAETGPGPEISSASQNILEGDGRHHQSGRILPLPEIGSQTIAQLQRLHSDVGGSLPLAKELRVLLAEHVAQLRQAVVAVQDEQHQQQLQGHLRRARNLRHLLAARLHIDAALLALLAAASAVPNGSSSLLAEEGRNAGEADNSNGAADDSVDRADGDGEASDGSSSDSARHRGAALLSTNTTSGAVASVASSLTSWALGQLGKIADGKN